MERLCYETLKKRGNTEYKLENGPEKVLQFGEGNFLRGFADYFIDQLNEKENFNGKVVVVQPIATGLANTINEQDGLYQLYLRGNEGGKKVNRRRLISCLSRAINPYDDFESFLKTAHNPDMRYIVSNTTEAGIAYDDSCKFEDKPQTSFPAKLTRLLYERFTIFGDASGYVILSCELIDDNGAELRKIVIQHAKDWKLGEEFIEWIMNKNIFCSTLVDRIVTGYPRNEFNELNTENGYEDKLLNTAEVFGFWVIEGPRELEEELPFRKAGLPVIFTDDQSGYKKRKVRILNGAHTSMVLAAYLAGQDIVRECMQDDIILGFMKKTIFDEIIPTLTLPKEELIFFAEAVMERFNNPFIDHRLLDISLNSVSKWKARVLPSMIGYYDKYNKLPNNNVFSFAALIAFYSGKEIRSGALIGNRQGQEYQIIDDAAVLNFFAQNTGKMSDLELINAFAGTNGFFEQDLTKYQGFTEAVARHLSDIHEKGMKTVLATMV
jgi:tagaturonate reductase